MSIMKQSPRFVPPTSHLVFSLEGILRQTSNNNSGAYAWTCIELGKIFEGNAEMPQKHLEGLPSVPNEERFGETKFKNVQGMQHASNFGQGLTWNPAAQQGKSPHTDDRRLISAHQFFQGQQLAGSWGLSSKLPAFSGSNTTGLHS